MEMFPHIRQVHSAGEKRHRLVHEESKRLKQKNKQEKVKKLAQEQELLSSLFCQTFFSNVDLRTRKQSK
jgi:hypothetical protein